MTGGGGGGGSGGGIQYSVAEYVLQQHDAALTIVHASQGDFFCDRPPCHFTGKSVGQSVTPMASCYS